MAISKSIATSMEQASWIRRMFEAGNELRNKFGAENVFDFTLGNPTTEPPAKFGEVLRELVTKPAPGSHRYMSNNGFAETRVAVAKGLSAPMEHAVPADNIILTVGAAGALNITLKAILDPDDEVIYLAPYFPEYRFYIENHCGRPVIVETAPNFMPDLAALEAALTPRTKAIIINTPNNPTGVIYTAEVLTQMNSLLLAYGEAHGTTIFVIADEPYRKLIYDVPHIPQTLDIFKNAVLCTSHSKDLGLPGERIGFAAVSPRCADRERLIPAMVFCNRTLGFVNAPALMQRVIAQLQDVTVDIADYKAKRDMFYDGLKSAGYSLERPGGAFYLFVKSPLPDDVVFVQKLLSHNILAVPGSGFGRSGWFRLSYCVDMQTIERSLPLFVRAIES